MAGERLGFEIDDALETSLVTPRAGVPSLIEAFRQTGAAAMIDNWVKVKTRKRGLSSSQMVESLLALWAAGGECCEDLDRLRQDAALAGLLGYELPAAQTARDFLTGFHEDDLPLLHEGKSTVPSESAPLLGLAAANRELILDLQCRKPVRSATLDIDATVIASSKRSAKYTFEGERATSRFWPCGRSRTSSSPTSSATATCRRLRMRDDREGGGGAAGNLRQNLCSRRQRCL